MKKSLRIVLIILAAIIIVTLGLVYTIIPKQSPDLLISDPQIVNSTYLRTNSYVITIKNNGDKAMSMQQIGTHPLYGLDILVVLTKGMSYPDAKEIEGGELQRITWGQDKLEPGQSIMDTLVVVKPNHLDKGEYVCFIVDPENLVKEMNEENNFTNAKIFNKSEMEEMKLREKIPIKEYLGHFKNEFPSKGETWIHYDWDEHDYLLKNKLILLENGILLGPVVGAPYTYKKVNSDVIWINTTTIGEYGGQTTSLLYVLNTKKNSLSKPYLLSTTFGEDGWYDHQDGEFINDSTFQYKHYWNEEDFTDDSAFGTIVIPIK